MSRIIPSPQTLRHLRRLYAIEPTIATTTTPARSRQRPLQRVPSQFTHNKAFSTLRILHQEAQPQTPPRPSDPQQPAATDPSLPDITNYYTLFPQTLPSGPPPSSPFEINLGHLRREFLTLQSKYHPDKFPAGTPSHQKSLALSSLLNTAYKTLSDPLLRGRYLLLEKYGIDVTSEDNSIHGGVTDQGTLLEVMEAQEVLEEVTTHEEIGRLMEENIARIRETEAILGKAFRHEDVEAAKTECVRLNYWRSLQSALREWEPGKEVRLVH